MKTLAELAAIRDRMKNKVAIRDGENEIRIVVGMATCGIASGARPVLNTLVEEVDKAGLNGSVTVSQTGCQYHSYHVQNLVRIKSLLSCSAPKKRQKDRICTKTAKCIRGPFAGFEILKKQKRP